MNQIGLGQKFLVAFTQSLFLTVMAIINLQDNFP